MRRTTTRSTRWTDDRGMIAVWVALGLVVLMLFAALAIDGGQAYSSRRQSQNASDAGAMAGVRQLVELKFPLPDEAPPASDTLAQQVLDQAHNSGADTAADGVQCYVVDRLQQRVISDDLCAGGVAQSFTPTTAMVGVEVIARQTKDTNFARVVGIDDTSAETSAMAIIQNYENPNGSVFVVCGSQADAPEGTLEEDLIKFAYDILDKDTTTTPATYSVKNSALLKYYTLQASQVPGCGVEYDDRNPGEGASFKGLLDSSVGVYLNQWTDTTPGNATSGEVIDTVVGITPCTEDQINANPPELDGCGLLIPISSANKDLGSNLQTMPRVWTVWRVWGDGTGNGPPGGGWNNIGVQGLGDGCGNGNGQSSGPPFAYPQGGGMKYCGQLLGSIQLSGGEGGGGPLNRGAIVVKLVE